MPVEGAFRFIKKLYDRRTKVSEHDLPKIGTKSLLKKPKARKKRHDASLRATERSVDVYEKTIS